MLFKIRCLVVDVVWKLFYHEIDLETPRNDGKIVITLKMIDIPCFVNTDSNELVFPYITE